MPATFNPRTLFFRATCWVLAVLVASSPSLTVLAQTPETSGTTLLADPAIAPAGLKFMLPQSCAVLSIRPRQILSSKFVRMYPVEVLQAASLKYAGFDPLEAETLMASVEPPMAGPPNYSLAASFSAGYKPTLHPQLTAHTQPGQLGGKEYLKSQHPLMPSFFTAEGSTLLAAPDMTLQKFVNVRATPEPTVLTGRLSRSTKDDLYLAVDLQPLRPLINQLLMQQQIPDEFQFVYALPDLIRLVELRMNITGNGPTELLVEANNEFDASKLLTILEQATQSWIDKALIRAEEMKQSEDPIEQAMGRYIERISGQSKSELMPKQDGAKLIVFRTELGGDMTGMTAIATSGVLVALLLPAVQAAREAARRTTSINNLKQIMLALLNYHDAMGRFPAHANYNEAGKPLLSWRVHILPYLEGGQLYEQFHLDEPWDSEHNRQLIEQMPAFYLDPSSPKYTPEMGHTHYLGIKGENAAFNPGPEGNKIRTFTDGTSNTLMVLQVNDERATIWTQPDDWELNEGNPLAGLVPGIHPTIFNAAFTDGSVRSFANDLDIDVFKKAITRSGREVFDWRQLGR